MYKVSIITPVYNSSYIDEAIKSVINQTYKNWELLVIDDCSNDDSVQIIKKYSEKDTRIYLKVLNKNHGAAEARNIALRIARGDYIAFLDSDDMWHSKKLEKQIEFMQKNNYAFSFTAYERVNESNTSTINHIGVPEKIGYKGFLKNTIIGTLTVIIDKRQTGYFEMPNIRSSHDMALWCEIMKRGFMAYGLDETLAFYRVVEDSNTSKKWKAAKDVWRVYREIEHLNYLRSLYNFSFYAFNAIKKRLN